ALLVVAAEAALWIAGVRDWRLLALWLLSPLVLSTLAIGNATVVVAVLAAVLWRDPGSPGPAAAAPSPGVALQRFPPPPPLPRPARRFRAAAYTAIAAPVAMLLAWAAIGFSGLGRYRDILSANRDVFGRDGPYLQQLLLQLDGTWRWALAAGIAAAVVLLAAA